MAATRQILQRLRAADNISKVTGTMETVSAVKYRNFYKTWRQGTDFYDALAQLAYLIVTAEETIVHPLMSDNESACNAILVIGSDRGLCGAHNTSIYRLIDTHLKMAQRFGRQLKVYAHGKKVVAYLTNRGIDITRLDDDFDQVPSPAQAKKIGDHFIDLYLAGEIGRLGIVYTRFFSIASQRPQTLTILPVAELIDDLTTRATVIWPWEVAFEDFLVSPSPEAIFDALATMIIHTVISECFLDAAASEHLQRVIAMRNATDNAAEMIESLTKDYNLARQSQITEELLDIIGGTLV